MKTFYPSSSAFMLGDVVITKYNSGCLRSILIKGSGIREDDIAEVYQSVGKAAEELHARELDAGPEYYEAEYKIKEVLRQDINGQPTVVYSGRADFRTKTRIDEIKGHISKNTRREVIRKGNYNISYLAQLVSYMVKTAIPYGRLVCGYFEDDEGQLVCQEKRIFEVEVDDDGLIWVDDTQSGYSVFDLLSHQKAAVEVLETGRIWDRPDKSSQKFDSPCTFCSFKEACDRHDKEGLSTEAFLWAAQDAVDGLEGKPPPLVNKVKKPKPPKEKKKRTKK